MKSAFIIVLLLAIVIPTFAQPSTPPKVANYVYRIIPILHANPSMLADMLGGSIIDENNYLGQSGGNQSSSYGNNGGNSQNNSGNRSTQSSNTQNGSNRSQIR